MSEDTEVFVKVEEVECSFDTDTSIGDCELKDSVTELSREPGDFTIKEEEHIEELVCKVEPVDFYNSDHELSENEQTDNIENLSQADLTDPVNTEPSVDTPTKAKTKKSKTIKSNSKIVKITFPCKYCEKVFNLKSSVINHEKCHRADKYYYCDLCPKRYTHSSNLKSHKIQFHLGQKNYQCSVCNKYLGKKYTLKSHLKTHEKSDGPKERPFECEICQKAFYNKDLLRKHRRTHDGLQPFSCEICDKRFAKKEKLIRHLRHHVNEEPNAPQIIQFRQQITAITLRLTRRDQRYICHICQGSYSQKSYLDQHIKTIHEGYKPYKCEFCEEAFSRRDPLISHLRKHTGVKPFFCEICQKAFSGRTYFTAHMRLHSGETPFACQLCEKKFVRKFELKAHQLSHTGEKPFECDICQKRYKLLHLLKRHKETHSGSTVSCKCGKKFGGIIKLKEHKKICKKLVKTEDSLTECSVEILGM